MKLTESDVRAIGERGEAAWLRPGSGLYYEQGGNTMKLAADWLAMHAALKELMTLWELEPSSIKAIKMSECLYRIRTMLALLGVTSATTD